MIPTTLDDNLFIQLVITITDTNSIYTSCISLIYRHEIEKILTIGRCVAGTLYPMMRFSNGANEVYVHGAIGKYDTPKSLLHVHGSSESFLQLTTNVTGSGDKYDGFTIGVNSSGARLIRTNYNKAIYIQSESGTTPGSFVNICSFGLYSEQGITPETYFYGNVNIVGQITGGLAVTGDTSITGNMTVSGTITSIRYIWQNLKLESTNASLTIVPIQLV